MKDKKIGELNILKKAFRVLYNLFTIFCLLLILVIVVQRFTDSYGSINGYRLFVVVSGSMIPKYGIGEVVLCKEIDAEKLEVGETIVYRGNTGELKGKFIMHDIVNKRYDENNKLIISAKGLLGSSADPDITENQIMGLVIFKSGLLTFLYALAMNKTSFVIIMFILLLNVFFSFKADKHQEKIEQIEKRNKLEQLGEDVNKKIEDLEEDFKVNTNIENNNIEDNYVENKAIRKNRKLKNSVKKIKASNEKKDNIKNEKIDKIKENLDKEIEELDFIEKKEKKNKSKE